MKTKTGLSRAQQIVAGVCQKLGIYPTTDTTGIGYDFTAGAGDEAANTLFYSTALNDAAGSAKACAFVAKRLEAMGLGIDIRGRAGAQFGLFVVSVPEIVAETPEQKLFVAACRAEGFENRAPGVHHGWVITGDRGGRLVFDNRGHSGMATRVHARLIAMGAQAIVEGGEYVLVERMPQFGLGHVELLAMVEEALLAKHEADRELRALMSTTGNGEKYHAHFTNIHVLIGKWLALQSLYKKLKGGDCPELTELEERHAFNR